MLKKLCIIQKLKIINLNGTFGQKLMNQFQRVVLSESQRPILLEGEIESVIQKDVNLYDGYIKLPIFGKFQKKGKEDAT